MYAKQILFYLRDSCKNFKEKIDLKFYQKPEKDEWGTGLDAMQAALVLEKNCNQSLMDLHEIAGKHNDSHVSS